MRSRRPPPSTPRCWWVYLSGGRRRPRGRPPAWQPQVRANISYLATPGSIAARGSMWRKDIETQRTGQDDRGRPERGPREAAAGEDHKDLNGPGSSRRGGTPRLRPRAESWTCSRWRPKTVQAGGSRSADDSKGTMTANGTRYRVGSSPATRGRYGGRRERPTSDDCFYARSLAGRWTLERWPPIRGRPRAWTTWPSAVSPAG